MNHDLYGFGTGLYPSRKRRRITLAIGALGVNTPAEAERTFNPLAEKGTVRLPLEETFWAQRGFGPAVAGEFCRTRGLTHGTLQRALRRVPPPALHQS